MLLCCRWKWCVHVALAANASPADPREWDNVPSREDSCISLVLALSLTLSLIIGSWRVEHQISAAGLYDKHNEAQIRKGWVGGCGWERLSTHLPSVWILCATAHKTIHSGMYKFVSLPLRFFFFLSDMPFYKKYWQALGCCRKRQLSCSWWRWV